MFPVSILYIVCLLAAFYASLLYKRRRYFGICRKIPTPVTIPIIQESFLTMWHRFNIVKAFDLLGTTKNGPIFRIWGRQLLVFVGTPDIIEAVFTNPKLQNRGPIMDGITEFLGEDCLFSAKAEKMKAPKRAFLRSFNMTTPREHIQNFQIETNRLLDAWKKTTKGSWVKAIHDIETATAKSIVRSTLEKDLSDHLDELTAMFHLKDILGSLIRRGFSKPHRNDFLFEYIFGGRKIKILKASIDKTHFETLSSIKKEFEEKVSSGKELPNTFCFNLLKEIPDLSSDDLLQHTYAAVLGATDTSATTIAFTLSLLSMNPDIMQRVYEEDKRVTEELKGREMEDKDFTKYEYLTRVIKETLRLYPSAPICPRIVESDTKIGEYIFPRRTCLMATPIMVHRNPDVFPDPLKFDPDRFLPENVEKRSKYAYIPFAAGPRGCPGYRYALHASIFMVSAIIRNFKVHSWYQSVAEMDKNLDMTLTLHDKNSFPMMLEMR